MENECGCKGAGHMKEGMAIQDIQKQIDDLANRLKAQLAADEPIDPKRIEQLVEMRRDRDHAYAKYQAARLEEMKNRTKEWMREMPIIHPYKIDVHPSIMESVRYQETLYDEAAERWVNDGVCPWEDSEAAAIAKEILAKLNEIR